MDKGPFPQPETEVRVQVVSRDEETGRVRLKVTPVHGDRVYMETGGSTPTDASRLVDGEVEVENMNVSFITVDSRKVHAPGTTYQWTNTVSIRHRFYQDGDVLRCELRAAPPVRVHYTTDGSNPVTNGGVYTEPFIVPKGARFVLAAPADGKGKTETIMVPAEPEKPSVNLEKACSWSRKHHFASTMETFQFLALCRKHGAWLAGTKVYIGTDRHWVEVLSDNDNAQEADRVEKAIETLRELYDLMQGSVSLDVSGLNFETGQSLMDLIAALRTTLKHGEVREIEPQK